MRDCDNEDEREIDEHTGKRRYRSCKDHMCGASDCPKCNPWNFRGGVFIADCDSEEAED